MSAFGIISCISGLFRIFNFNLKFCIGFTEDKHCTLCGYSNSEKNLYKKSLLQISNEDIKLQTLSNILSYKLIDYISSCPECYKNFGIIMNSCSSRLHDFVFPEFLSVIFEFTDLNDHSIGDYQILKKNLNSIKTLYNNKLELPQIGLNYYLKAIIYMDGPMH